MSSDDARSGWRRGALADPDRSRGCFRRVGDELGSTPRPCTAGIRRGFGSVAGDRSGTTTDEARRTGESVVVEVLLRPRVR